MSIPLVIIGGGEHARVVAEAARAAGLYVAGFVDPKPCEETVARLKLSRLGDEALDGASAVLGVGAIGPTAVRRGIVERLAGRVRDWRIVVHGTAWVSPSAELAEGTVIMAGALVNSGARIGRHCIVNTGAVIEHDVVLGDFANIAPGVTVGGGTIIGVNAFVGLGSSVRDHIRIGDGAFVRMGTVVTQDVATES